MDKVENYYKNAKFLKRNVCEKKKTRGYSTFVCDTKQDMVLITWQLLTAISVNAWTFQ